MTTKDNSVLRELNINIGNKTSYAKTITETDILDIARISGDFASIHIDKEFASKTLFNDCIAHGVFSQALLSAAMAKLPGIVITITQYVRFLKPIRAGDTITAVVEVTDLRTAEAIITLKQTCYNQNNEVVVDGEGKCKLYMPPV
ncbi:MaoC family dehydratase [Chloroflexota bacterium]